MNSVGLSAVHVSFISGIPFAYGLTNSRRHLGEVEHFAGFRVNNIALVEIINNKATYTRQQLLS